MSDRKIKQVKVSKVFWKDLGEVRKKTEYWAIRKSIAKTIESAFKGKEINDRTFQNRVWEGIAHIKTPGKLILFTRREADETLALAGLRKHDSYGYKNESKGAVASTAKTLLNGLAAGPVRSPEWSSISWSTPMDILNNPEVSEMSREGLEKLLAVLTDESYTLERLERKIEKVPLELRGDFENQWFTAVDDAMIFLKREIQNFSKRSDQHLSVSDFESWKGPS